MKIWWRGCALGLAWLGAGAAIYGGGLYEAAGGSGAFGGGGVPEARLDCDAECISAWTGGLAPSGAASYGRFQLADAAHALLGAGLLALASARLARGSRWPRGFAVLAPAALAVAELLENATLIALASGAALPWLAASAVDFRACKFVALVTSVGTLTVLALAALGRRWHHPSPGAVR